VCDPTWIRLAGLSEELFDLASAIRARSSGRVQREAETLVDYARSYLARFARDPTAEPTAQVPRCRVLASTAFKPQPDEIWALVFTKEATFLRSLDRSENVLARIEYAELTEIAVGEPPAYRTTGEAALKIGASLLASMSPVRAPSDNIYSVGVTLRSSSGELILLHRSELTIDAWRMRLAPAIERVKFGCAAAPRLTDGNGGGQAWTFHFGLIGAA
jgi:hypothetical protein